MAMAEFSEERPAGAALASLGAVTLHRATTAEVLDRVFDALAAGRGGRIVTLNLELLQQTEESARVAELYGRADLRVADGMPLLWLSRLAGCALPERVAGSDLVWSASARAAREGRTLYLLGGDTGVAEQAARVLAQHARGLRVLGWASPRVSVVPTEEELAPIRAQLQCERPDLVFCAFGSPKQEYLAAALAPALPGTWWLGCGHALSFVAGASPRAPRWIQRLGLEWLHRAGHDPSRLGPRYFARNLPYLARSVLHLLSRRAVSAGTSHE
jgi:N-acetylglucosaminyldiphosphoundecaprenol N-acetyl-beta-D-mannosaminyltransferase